MTQVIAECSHCNGVGLKHQEDHPGLCCDCFDLRWGMPIEQLNAERAQRGAKPLTKPWPKRTTEE